MLKYNQKIILFTFSLIYLKTIDSCENIISSTLKDFILPAYFCIDNLIEYKLQSRLYTWFPGSPRDYNNKILCNTKQYWVLKMIAFILILECSNKKLGILEKEIKVSPRSIGELLCFCKILNDLYLIKDYFSPGKPQGF